MAFLIGWILFFALFYIIAGVKFDEGDYDDLSPTMIVFLQTFRNSIGDIATPHYPEWSTYKKSTNKSESLIGHIMIFIIWFFWFFHEFVILILLLNFLIAIISQSYEMVMAHQVMSTYIHRCQLNKDCLIVLDYFNQLSEINFFTIATLQEEKGIKEDVLSEMKKYIAFSNRVLLE